MKQFDVFANPASAITEAAPFVVVLSSDLIDLPTVLAAPLVANLTHTLTRVDVRVRFEDQNLVLPLLFMGAISPGRLKRPLGSLVDYDYAIRRGIDRLFTGF